MHTSGEAESVSEAIGFLRMNGVNPPSEILSYLQNEEVRGSDAGGSIYSTHPPVAEVAWPLPNGDDDNNGGGGRW